MAKNMKRILHIISILFLSIPIHIASAQDNEEIIKIGYIPNYGIINSPNVKGAEGYGYEYLSEIEKYTNYKFVYEEVKWSDGLELLKNGELDLLGPAFITKQRLEDYEFVDTPFLHDSISIYAPKNDEYFYGDPSQFNGKTVAIEVASMYVDIFKQYEKKHQIELDEIYVDYSEFKQLINQRNVDLFVSGALHEHQGMKIVDTLQSQDIHLMSLKNNLDIVENINQAMIDIEKDDHNFSKRLEIKYYPKTHSTPKSFTEDEVNALNMKDIYKVGYHANLAPLSYQKNDEPVGFAIDVMELLAKELDIQVEYIPLSSKEDYLRDDLDFNLCILEHGIEQERWVSDPYDHQNIVIMKNKDKRNDEIKDVLILDYYALEIEEFIDRYSNANIHKVYSSSQSSNALHSIDVDCRISIESRMQLLIHNYDRNEIDISILGIEMPLNIIVSNKLPRVVLDALNKSIASLEKNQVNEIIYNNTTSVQGEFNLILFINKYRYQILAGTGIICVILALLRVRNLKNKSKKLQEDYSLQETLHHCIDILYSMTTKTVTSTVDDRTKAFTQMLTALKNYYQADRSYFYQIKEGSTEVEEIYEILDKNVPSSKHEYEKIPERVKLILLNILKVHGVVSCDDINELIPNKNVSIVKNYEKHNVKSFTYSAIMDVNKNLLGFIGIDNPRLNMKNTELMKLLSNFVFMFIKNEHNKLLQEESSKLEISSRTRILKKCSKYLTGTSYIDHNIVEIMTMLRIHYGATSVVMVRINQEKNTFMIKHISLSDESHIKRLIKDEYPIVRLERWLEKFKNKSEYAVVSFDELNLTIDDQLYMLKQGVMDALITPTYDENKVLIGFLSVNNPSVINRSRDLIHVISKLISDFEISIEIQKKATLDSLSKLYNKMETQRRITDLINSGVMGTLMIIDVDNFKKLNDTLGHQFGDQAIKDVARILENNFRQNDIIGRIGGDEFMIFCPNPITNEIIIQKAISLIKTCKLVYACGNLTTKISISIGICRTNNKDVNFEYLYKEADRALYESKKKGKNQYTLYDEDI